MHVLIAGGGLGGLSLAQTLRKQGISFEIFERDVAPDSRFQGWAIALYGEMLANLVSSFPSDMPDMKESTDHLKPLKLPAQLCMYGPGLPGRLGVEDSPEVPLLRAERLRLRNWLSTNLPVQWGKHLQSVSEDADGVTVHFEDGTTAKGDLLIGADGINSVVREHILQKKNSDLLNDIPLSAIVGQLELSGDAFKRQLELGHSAYLLKAEEMSFFCGLHEANPDGVSGKYYWMWMKADPNVVHPDHWLQTASQEEKLAYVLDQVAGQQPRHREIFELTPASGIRKEPYLWRDLQLPVGSLPAGRIVLLGDAAHAMTPFRGEGGFHTLIDTLKLSQMLGKLHAEGGSSESGLDMKAVEAAVAEYNAEMLARGFQAVQESRGMHVSTNGGGTSKAAAWRGAKPLPEEKIELPIGAA